MATKDRSIHPRYRHPLSVPVFAEEINGGERCGGLAAAVRRAASRARRGRATGVRPDSTQGEGEHVKRELRLDCLIERTAAPTGSPLAQNGARGTGAQGRGGRPAERQVFSAVRVEHGRTCSQRTHCRSRHWPSAARARAIAQPPRPSHRDLRAGPTVGRDVRRTVRRCPASHQEHQTPHGRAPNAGQSSRTEGGHACLDILVHGIVVCLSIRARLRRHRCHSLRSNGRGPQRILIVSHEHAATNHLTGKVEARSRAGRSVAARHRATLPAVPRLPANEPRRPGVCERARRCPCIGPARAHPPRVMSHPSRLCRPLPCPALRGA